MMVLYMYLITKYIWFYKHVWIGQNYAENKKLLKEIIVQNEQNSR